MLNLNASWMKRNRFHWKVEVIPSKDTSDDFSTFLQEVIDQPLPREGFAFTQQGMYRAVRRAIRKMEAEATRNRRRPTWNEIDPDAFRESDEKS